ncbi:CPBP family intramembrane metalloprotease [Candidatus Saccharibacteria bacterium CPR2]|nr:CPBP family intramembrane metalloprotease [Candidatus Saccharibacteria bacterium CPR2]
MSEDSSNSLNKVLWSPIPVILFSLVIYILPQIIIVILLSLVDKNLVENINSGENISWQFALYALTGFISVGLLLWYLGKCKITLSQIGLTKRNLTKIWYAIPAFGLYFLITTGLFALTQRLFPNLNLEQDQKTAFDSASANSEIFLAFLAFCVVAPIAEELIFRGFLYKGLRTKLKPLIAGLITSLLFGLAHFQLNVGMDTFALSLLLVWLAEETKSLWPSITLHAMKNFVAFLLYFIIKIPI